MLRFFKASVFIIFTTPITMVLPYFLQNILHVVINTRNVARITSQVVTNPCHFLRRFIRLDYQTVAIAILLLQSHRSSVVKGSLNSGRFSKNMVGLIIKLLQVSSTFFKEISVLSSKIKSIQLF